jgi:hypothetical protein
MRGKQQADLLGKHLLREKFTGFSAVIWNGQWKRLHPWLVIVIYN